MQTEYPSDKDYLNDMPQSIIEIILTKLPLRDAIRTSILSSTWRYKWATLTHIDFDDDCVSGIHDKFLAEFTLVKVICRFFLLHNGPINRFSLSTTYLQSIPDVDQWLIFLSKKDIKELVLDIGKNKFFKAPSCLFSCQKLVRLELFRWELNPPLSFKGFPFLKHLILQRVDITSSAIENLISGCPLLESLDLSHYDSLELTIHAPNLKHLILEGELKDISIENAPKLVSINISMYMNDDIAEHFRKSSSCNFEKFLGGVPSLQRLIGRSYFARYMSIGDTFGKTQMMYQQLKAIELSEVSFENMKEIMVILRLILNAPILEELQIAGSSNSSSGLEAPDLDFWDKEGVFECTFERLKLVKMKGMFGIPHEVGFIGFLLGNSPVLETMSIKPSNYMTEDKFSFLIELTRLQRASPKAEMIFVHNV